MNWEVREVGYFGEEGGWEFVAAVPGKVKMKVEMLGIRGTKGPKNNP
jgi:hypothetical protein